MEPRLRDHLDRHQGVVSARAASALGLDGNALRALTRAGTLVRVTRGAYVDGDLLRSGSPEAQHAMRTRAVVLSRGGALAASHESAAVLHGLPVMRSELATVHVVHTTDRVNTRRHDAFTVHPCPGTDALTTRGGVRMVVPALAILGTAVSAGVRSGLMAADAALHGGLTSKDDLHDWLGRMRRHPGISRARHVVLAADASAESPGESLLREILLRLGYEVAPQSEIREGGVLVARVDFLLPRLGVVVEFDGMVKYEGSQGPEALAAEKARERRLRRLGYGVARIVWRDLFDEARIEAEIRDAARGR